MLAKSFTSIDSRKFVFAKRENFVNFSFRESFCLRKFLPLKYFECTFRKWDYVCQNGLIFKDTSSKKRDLKQNWDAYEKFEYEHSGSWYIKLTLCKRFLYWKQILKKEKQLAAKASFFLINLFCTPNSFCLNSFVWKCHTFNSSTFN